MPERIKFDAPAGIVGLMVAYNCLTDALATIHPPLSFDLAVRYEAKIAELEEADEEAHKLAAVVVKSLLGSLQLSPRALQRDEPVGTA